MIAPARRRSPSSARSSGRRSAGDPRALETSLTLDGVAYHIVGVTPAGWRFFETPVDGYLALGPRQSATMRRDAHGSIRAVGRLAAGRPVQAAVQAAREDLDAIMRRLVVETATAAAALPLWRATRVDVLRTIMHA
jgi:hypothetical protein